jgi:hypothetical protein
MPLALAPTSDCVAVSLISPPGHSPGDYVASILRQDSESAKATNPRGGSISTPQVKFE